MLLPNMRIKATDSLTIALDHPQGDLCFVSHAHSDHTAALRTSKPIFASEQTLFLAGAKNASLSPEGISLHSAGHMLGAMQLHAQLDGETLTYTGDFKLTESFTCKGAQILPCDTLVIESTYGSPKMKFPPREEVLSQMEKWVAESLKSSAIIFGAYTMGKAQELTAFLNKQCGISPIVSSRIDSVCSKYESLGVPLSRVCAGTQECAEAMRSPFVAIMPSNSVNFSFANSLSQAYNMNVLCAQATGWALSRPLPVDRAFPLSDHADFSEILSYIEGAHAKKIVCAASSGNREMAAHLRSMGYNAVASEEVGAQIQQVLA